MGMDALTFIATAAGLGWASGMRAYAVLFFLGVLHHAGTYELRVIVRQGSAAVSQSVPFRVAD